MLTDPPLEVIAAGRHNRVPLIIGNNGDETYLGFPLGSIPDDETYPSKVYELFGQEGGDLVLAQYPSTSYSSPERAYIYLGDGDGNKGSLHHRHPRAGTNAWAEGESMVSVR